MGITNIVADAITASRREITTTHIRPASLDEYNDCYDTLLVECNDNCDDHDCTVFWGDDWQVRLYEH